MHRDHIVLYRRCSVVNWDYIANRLGVHRGNVNTVRTHANCFRKSVSVHHGIPAVLHRGVSGPNRVSEYLYAIILLNHRVQRTPAMRECGNRERKKPKAMDIVVIISEQFSKQ